MKPLAEPAIAAVERGDIQIVPENRRQEYFQLDEEHPGLDAVAAALVGTPDFPLGIARTASK